MESDTGQPPPLDQLTVERVLARAAELHGDMARADGLSEAQLLAIAHEVGLSAASVRQALAEERTRVAVDDVADVRAGWLTRAAGPGIVSATRLLPGAPADTIAALDRWMQSEECLQVQRRFPDRMVWEPRADWIGAVRRGLRLGGRAYQLCRARVVAATVVPADDGRVIVRLDADVTPRRTRSMRLGAAAGASGIAMAGAAGTIGAVVHATLAVVAIAAAIPVGVSAAAAYAVVRRHHTLAIRTKLALEQVLDRMEYQDVRPTTTLLDVLGGVRPLLR